MRALLVLLLIIAGIGAGYYFGKTQGFEKSAGEFAPTVSDTKIVRNTSDAAAIKPSAVVARDIVGTWKSSDDSSFTRTFAVDGSVIDTYAGNKTANTKGMWKAFMSPDEKVPFSMKEGIVYLKLTMPEEVIFFSVTSITSSTLELMYPDGGSTLKFTKVH